MKNRTVLLLLVASAAVALAAAGARSMSVRKKSVWMQARPSPFGKRVAELKYGDRVTVMGQKGGWIEVASAPGTNGWLRENVLIAKRIVFAASSEPMYTGASSDEVELAYKGFNKQVEGEYKARNQNLVPAFKWVDYMESIDVTPARMEAFVAEGGLELAQGGVR